MLSFVLLNWNTAALSQRLIDSLSRQTSRNFELIIVDNGSDEPFAPSTPAWMETRLLSLDRNYGFAAGMNRGIQVARGDLICPTNSDVVFASDFVERALTLELDSLPHTKGTRVGIVGGLVLSSEALGEPSEYPAAPRARSLVDSTGSLLSWQGRLLELPLESINEPRAVFAVTGACPIFARQFCQEISFDGMVYDEHYHSYAEDIDLFMRARTHGWSVVYTPVLRAFHWGSMSTGGKRRIFDKSPELQRQIFRNMTWNVLKNFTLLELALYAPLQIINILFVAMCAAPPGRGLCLRAVLRGYVFDPFHEWSFVKRRRQTLQVRPWYDVRLLGEMLRCGWRVRR